MRRLKIIYDRERCRGLGMCAAIAPHQFRMKGKKAVLARGKRTPRTGEYSTILTVPAAESERIVKSGMACPVNAIRVIDMDTRKSLVQTRIVTHGAKRIDADAARPKDFVMDRKGYLLIRVDRNHGLIEVGLCRRKNQVDVIITGRNPTDIYYTILKKKLLSRFEHAAYIGKETQKAHTALQLGIEYVQDAPLDFSKNVKT